MPVERFCNSCETPLPDGAAFCPTCGEATPTALNQATGEAVAPSGPELDEAAYRRRLQRAIGRGYELGELIGQGGFGVVYSALDIELNREVAVKALRHDVLPTSALFQRFKREARAAAKLRHPHIVPIYAVGEGENIAFMIMPKLLGESLKAFIRREAPVGIDEAQRILGDAAQALAVAHRAGIVHRDVKPENIFLEGEERRVYLMDFGIAKAVDTDEEGLTGTGMIVGTPSYMSPEQSGGKREIDHRTDIYSLGVVGYQLLTGRLPYRAESLQELIYQQITVTPAPVSELRPEVPAGMAQAIDRCLHGVPDERWVSADDLAAALVDGASTAALGPKGSWKRPIGALALLAVISTVAYVGVRAGGNGDETGDGELPIAVVSGGAADGASTFDSVGPAPDSQAAPGAGEEQPSVPERQVETPPAAAEPARTVQRPAPPPAAEPEPAPAEAPQAVGYLTLNPRQGWARVYIDGVQVANAPRRYDLTPGEHIIMLRKPGYEEWVATVTISAGNPITLSPDLSELP